MYEDHFGLTAKAFENTPDPTFFFVSPHHEEAFANLMYAVTERKGFVLLTGEVGSGKTLVSRMLLERLGDRIRFAHITNTHITPKGIIHDICTEFNLEFKKSYAKHDLLHAFRKFLIDQYRHDQLVVLLIDEAQNLSQGAMEEVRMLSNLETEKSKLLQIVLLGQPELRKRMFDPALKQFRQRIAISYHLRSFSEQETRAYIVYRLGVVHKGKQEIFDDSALRLIARYSEGIPRVINAICDCSLLLGYSKKLPSVTGAVIEEVVRHHLPIVPDLQAQTPDPQTETIPTTRKADETGIPNSPLLEPHTYIRRHPSEHRSEPRTILPDGGQQRDGTGTDASDSQVLQACEPAATPHESLREEMLSRREASSVGTEPDSSTDLHKPTVPCDSCDQKAVARPGSSAKSDQGIPDRARQPDAVRKPYSDEDELPTCLG